MSEEKQYFADIKEVERACEMILDTINTGKFSGGEGLTALICATVFAAIRYKLNKQQLLYVISTQYDQTINKMETEK